MDILDTTRRLVASGPLCDSCLGRPVADRSFGLTNAERGRALRTTLALADDEPYEEPDEQCWVCEGIMQKSVFDSYATRCVEAVGSVEYDTYQVGTKTPPLIEENDALLRETADIDIDRGEAFKSAFNREVGKRVGKITGGEVSFERPDVQFLIDPEADTVECSNHSAFVYGRYRKLERDIPQTKWPCNACQGSGYIGQQQCEKCDGVGLLYETSVEQLTAPVVCDVMDGTETSFHGAGREDVDARMLGTGRPFVIEVFEPRRRDINTARLEGDINAFAEEMVEVTGLRLATYDIVERVKELDASKRYRAVVSFDERVDEDAFTQAVSSLENSSIEQRTPRRVSHRRADITRTREVYQMGGELHTPTKAVVDIHTAGGLYVKELISSDEGRTEPSLAELLEVSATVNKLDVTGVYGESVPFEKDTLFRDDRVVESPTQVSPQSSE